LNATPRITKIHLNSLNNSEAVSKEDLSHFTLNDSLHVLDFDGSELSGECVGLLSKDLRGNTSVIDLNLGEIVIGDKVKDEEQNKRDTTDMCCFFEDLHLSSVKRLTFQAFRFPKEIFEFMFKCLAKKDCLCELTIFGDFHDCVELGEYLESTQRLENVYIEVGCSVVDYNLICVKLNKKMKCSLKKITLGYNARPDITLKKKSGKWVDEQDK
jgi:hypothetical protein